MRARFFLLLPVLMLAGCTTLPEREDVRLCTRVIDVSKDPVAAVRSCTLAIDSGKLLEKDLADALNSRGVGQMNQGYFDLAIADFNAAVRLTPSDPNPLFNRAIAFRGAGNFSRAAEDCMATIPLAPTRSNNAFLLRGTVRFAQGRLVEAADDFAESNLRHPAGLTAAWLDATRARLGSDAHPELSKINETLPETRWPAPIVRFQLGILDLESLNVVVASDSPGHRCEAKFFVAEKYLANGDARHARQWLEETRGLCAPPSAIRVAVDAELARIPP